MSASLVSDGPIDAFYDTSLLSEKVKLKRQSQYTLYTVEGGHIRTAAGKDLDFQLRPDAPSYMDWVIDGNVSIAIEACDLCAEINACRPKGTPPFVCLVKASYQCKDRSNRNDGTSLCALCRHVRRGTGQAHACKARHRKDPASCLATLSKRKRIDDVATPERVPLNTSAGEDRDGSYFGSELTEEESEGTDEEGYRWLEPHQQVAARKILEEIANPRIPKCMETSYPQQDDKGLPDIQLPINRIRSAAMPLCNGPQALHAGYEHAEKTYTELNVDRIAEDSTISSLHSEIGEICCQQTALLNNLDILKDEKSSLLI